MRSVARGEMTTRKVVLIVWGVRVSIQHSNHMKLLFSSPKKERNFRYHQGVKTHVTFVFVRNGLRCG